jgi:hypothetical protein
VDRYKEIERLLAAGREVREITRALRCCRRLVRQIHDGLHRPPDQSKNVVDPLWMAQVNWPEIIHDLRLGHSAEVSVGGEGAEPDHALEFPKAVLAQVPRTCRGPSRPPKEYDRCGESARPEWIIRLGQLMQIARNLRRVPAGHTLSDHGSGCGVQEAFPGPAFARGAHDDPPPAAVAESRCFCAMIRAHDQGGVHRPHDLLQPIIA